MMPRCSGGEDYELLVTASRDTIDRVRVEMLCPVTVIGEIAEEPGSKVLDEAGNEVEMGDRGWDHFISRKQ